MVVLSEYIITPRKNHRISHLQEASLQEYVKYVARLSTHCIFYHSILLQLMVDSNLTNLPSLHFPIPRGQRSPCDHNRTGYRKDRIDSTNMTKENGPQELVFSDRLIRG